MVTRANDIVASLKAVTPIDPALLPEDRPFICNLPCEGQLVIAVAEGSDAAQKGLRPGDLLKQFCLPKQSDNSITVRCIRPSDNIMLHLATWREISLKLQDNEQLLPSLPHPFPRYARRSPRALTALPNNAGLRLQPLLCQNDMPHRSIFSSLGELSEPLPGENGGYDVILAGLKLKGSVPPNFTVTQLRESLSEYLHGQMAFFVGGNVRMSSAAARHFSVWPSERKVMKSNGRETLTNYINGFKSSIFDANEQYPTSNVKLFFDPIKVGPILTKMHGIPLVVYSPTMSNNSTSLTFSIIQKGKPKHRGQVQVEFHPKIIRLPSKEAIVIIDWKGQYYQLMLS